MSTTQQQADRTDHNLEIAGQTFMRGTRTIISVPMVEPPDGEMQTFSVSVLRGIRSGPVLYIGAGVHGDEIDGVNALANLLASVNETELSGSLLAVPVQNPLAYRAQHRLPLDLILKSPYDHGSADMYLEFPNKDDGNTTSIMAKALWDTVISRAHYVIDLHTPDIGGRFLPFAIIPPGDPASVDEAHRLAQAYGVLAVLQVEPGGEASLGSPAKVSMRNGAPSFLVEISEGGRHIPEEVASASAALRNVLRSLRMLDEPVKENVAPAVIQRFTLVRSRRGGLLHVSRDVGETVEKGEELAQIVSPHGQLLEKVCAPHAGLLVGKATLPTVWSGEEVSRIAVLVTDLEI